MGSIPGKNMKMWAFYVVFHLQNVQESMVEISFHFKFDHLQNILPKKYGKNSNWKIYHFVICLISIFCNNGFSSLSVKPLNFMFKILFVFSKCFTLKQIFTNLIKYRFENKYPKFESFFETSTVLKQVSKESRLSDHTLDLICGQSMGQKEGHMLDQVTIFEKLMIRHSILPWDTP